METNPQKIPDSIELAAERIAEILVQAIDEKYTKMRKKRKQGTGGAPETKNK